MSITDGHTICHQQKGPAPPAETVFWKVYNEKQVRLSIGHSDRYRYCIDTHFLIHDISNDTCIHTKILFEQGTFEHNII